MTKTGNRTNSALAWRLWKGRAWSGWRCSRCSRRASARPIVPLGAGNVAVNLLIAAVMLALLVTS